MDFCDYCDNMYYIKENDENKLIFYCKNCGSHKEIEDTSEAKQISTKNYDGGNEKYIKFINPNIVYDNTIPHVNNIDCPNSKCTKLDSDENNVVYIKYDNENIQYLYCCSFCKYFWTLN